MAQSNQVDAYTANLYARQNLLRSGIAMTKRLQVVTAAALGARMRIPLQRMGIMTGVTLHFTIPVTLATFDSVSQLAPFNIAQQVTYTDFAGVNRTKTNGFQLWCAQCFKQSDLIGAIPSQASVAGGAVPAYNYNNNIFNLPAANGAGSINFSLYVPMAYDPASDLTGAVLTQTNVGEHYIDVQLPNSLSGADPYAFPYGAATGVTLGGAGVQIQAFQHYIQPQSMTADQIPVIDLSTIYGFEGGYQSSANISANQAKFIDLPNNRSILSTLVQYEEAGVFVANEANVSGVTLLANSNTNFREMTPRLVREQMRNMVNADMPSSTYYIGSRFQPILTQLYANVQVKMDVTSANAGVTQMVSQYEVQYPSGVPLPGISNG
jgi:hypothetical protein